MSENSSNTPRGNCDPGWNDPPKLQYSPAQSAKGKLNLNKRIAFPLYGSSTSKPTAIVQPSPSLPLSTTAMPVPVPSQPPVAIVPPMPHCTPPPTQRIPSININESSSRVELSEELERGSIPENALEFCCGTFQSFISRIQEPNIRSDEIQRRINLMKQMWLSGTLTSSVHRKLLNIAKALEKNNFNEAIENHRALVVDHSSMCIGWAAALRQIILTIQSGNDNLSDQVPNFGSILVPNPIASDNLTSEAQSGSVGNDIQNI